jgi:hypothetical protein
VAAPLRGTYEPDVGEGRFTSQSGEEGRAIFDDTLRKARLKGILDKNPGWEACLGGLVLRLTSEGEKATITVTRKFYPEAMVSGEIRLVNPDGTFVLEMLVAPDDEAVDKMRQGVLSVFRETRVPRVLWDSLHELADWLTLEPTQV